MAAVYPVAAGHPVYSGTFIPEIWSAILAEKLWDKVVFNEICNKNWEREVKDGGDTVIIRQRPTIVTKKYTKGQVLEDQHPEAEVIKLLIDNGRYFSVYLDDVDKAQADINQMMIWGEDGSTQLKIDTETEIFADIYADVHASNTGATAGLKSESFNLGATGSPVTVSKVNILDYLIDCGTVLDEQNVPDDGRWFIIPAWMAGMIKKSDLKDASLTGDSESPVRNGRLGRIDRFVLYSSNLLSTYDADSATRCLFGHPKAWTFASQIDKVDKRQPSDTFGEKLRALMVCGWKVTLPGAMGMLYAKK